jgi:hypothetical protein
MTPLLSVRSAASAVLCVALVAGCASAPPPDWQLASASALQQGVDAYLSGLDKVASAEFARGQREVRRTADPDTVARAYLIECAARVAAADTPDCASVPGLADAQAATQAYARYLMGEASAVDQALLPEAQRLVSGRGLQDAASALRGVQESWSRLVAAGVLWRRGQLSLDAVVVAVDTAAAQGWSRAAGQWLTVQRELLTQAGDREGAAAVQRRLDLLLSTPATLKSPTATAPPN